jgi:hypothetical protein
MAASDSTEFSKEMVNSQPVEQDVSAVCGGYQFAVMPVENRFGHLLSSERSGFIVLRHRFVSLVQARNSRGQRNL